jgi:hypothetical protein
LLPTNGPVYCAELGVGDVCDGFDVGVGVDVACGVEEGVGVDVGFAVGVAVGVAVAIGVAVAFATDFAVATAVGVAVGLLVDEVQPLIDTARTRTPIQSNGNAYLSGVLIYRFIILAIGFIFFPPPAFCPSRDFTIQRDAKNVRS